jgi:4-alpha-glucanotransferase
VLSTCPEPLRCVLELHGLGRFRVTQKIDLDDAGDVYRSENARPQDWIMLGNHDTPTIWQAAARWVREGRGQRHAAYLAGRLLAPGTDASGWIARVAADPRALAQAKFAELFVGPARSVMVFFTDLFGLRAPYNRPGTVHPDNWSARLGPDFREEYAARLARSEALDLPRAMAVAIRARGDAFAAAHGPLLAQLDESGGSPHPLPPGPDGR